MENWTIVNDTKVRHVWRCLNCEDEINVSPWWYQDNGTPMCVDCDEDMEYVLTEYNNG